MKIAFRERFAHWYLSTLYLLPSLQFDFGRGYIDNLDTDRIQNHIEVDIHLSFLFFSSFLSISFMWGDEGDIEDEEPYYVFTENLEEYE